MWVSNFSLLSIVIPKNLWLSTRAIIWSSSLTVRLEELKRFEIRSADVLSVLRSNLLEIVQFHGVLCILNLLFVYISEANRTPLDDGTTRRYSTKSFASSQTFVIVIHTSQNQWILSYQDRI